MNVGPFKNLTPDNCFIAIARTGPEGIKKLPGWSSNGGDPDDFLNIRAVITSGIREASTLDNSIVIYKPPVPQKYPSTAHVLAIFEAITRFQFANNIQVKFFCRLVTGSPKGNLPYTIIIDKTEIYANEGKRK